MLFRRERFALLLAELLGTFTLTFVVLSVSKSAIGIPYFIAIAAGLTLAIMTLVFGKTQGLHVNPAVTFSMWTVKKIGTLQGLTYIVAQFMGAAFAWRLYTYLLNGPVPSIAGKEFDWRIFVAEMVGTTIFILGVSAAVYKNYEGGKLAATVGGALILGIIVASSLSNAVLNPAVALGIQSWSKEYVVAPLVGGLLAANIYYLLFTGERLSVSKPSLRLPKVFKAKSIAVAAKPAAKKATSAKSNKKKTTKKRK